MNYNSIPKLSNKCISIANYIICRINNLNENKSLKNQIILYSKKLQLLLFFCDVEHMLVYNGIPLFPDNYYTGFSVPTLPDFYRIFMQYQDGDMLPVVLDGENAYNITNSELVIIDEVINKIGNIGFPTLKKNISDREPWYTSFCRYLNDEKIVPKQTIYNYYLNHERPIDYFNQDEKRKILKINI